MPTITEFKKAGFEEQEVADHLDKQRAELRGAGFSDREINEHFGIEGPGGGINEPDDPNQLPQTPAEAEERAKQTLQDAELFEIPLQTAEDNFDDIQTFGPADPDDLPIQEVRTADDRDQLIAGPEPGFWKKFLTAGYEGTSKPESYWEMNVIKRFAFDAYMATRHYLTRIGGVAAKEAGLITPKDLHDLYGDEMINNPEWFTKGPELVGWTAEKAAEFYVISGLFRATGTGRLLSKAGQKLAAPFIAKEIVSVGGTEAVKTLSKAGLKKLGTDALVAFLKHAPGNITFLAAWSGGSQALKGREFEEQQEEISEQLTDVNAQIEATRVEIGTLEAGAVQTGLIKEAADLDITKQQLEEQQETFGASVREATASGALWGLGFAILTPVVGAAGKALISTPIGQKAQLAVNRAYTWLWQNHPRIMNAGRKHFNDDLKAEATRQFRSRFGIEPTPADAAKINKITRDMRKELTKQAQKNAATAAYWNSGNVSSEAVAAEKAAQQATKTAELAKGAKPAAVTAKPPAITKPIKAPVAPATAKTVQERLTGEEAELTKWKAEQEALPANQRDQVFIDHLDKQIADKTGAIAGIDQAGLEGDLGTGPPDPTGIIDQAIVDQAIQKLSRRELQARAKQLGITGLNKSNKELLVAISKRQRFLADQKKDQLLDKKRLAEIFDKTKPFVARDPKPLKQKAKEAGSALIEIARSIPRLFFAIFEPSRAVEKKLGGDAFATVIRGIHRPEVRGLEFSEKELTALDLNYGQLGDWLAQFSDDDLLTFMDSRGNPVTEGGKDVQATARVDLAKIEGLNSPELVEAIQEIADFNFEFLTAIADGDIKKVKDYFYGIYENPRSEVDTFLDKFFRTTQRFTKEKKIPTVADATSFGLRLRDNNPVENLRSEMSAIARLEGMIFMRDELLRTGQGEYIDNFADAPDGFLKVGDEPVFNDVRVHPDLARLINNLISTNKTSQWRALRALRGVNNFLRTLKFAGSGFHLITETSQSIADTPYLDPTSATRGFTKGFTKDDPIFKTPEYRDYIEHGGGHKFSVEAQAQADFKSAIQFMSDGKALGGLIKGALTPARLLSDFTEWMFSNYIPQIKYSKYLDFVADQERRLGRPLESIEKIRIIKEQQNFYGEMNERLFGRSGTVTSVLRFVFLAPGFAEGNYRTVIKALSEWAADKRFTGPSQESMKGNAPEWIKTKENSAVLNKWSSGEITDTKAVELSREVPDGGVGQLGQARNSAEALGTEESVQTGKNARRSRANIFNSLVLKMIAATTGTLILTGKPPKRPENLEDFRDLFKMDTGKLDDKGRRVLIDLLTYDKDYYNILFGSAQKGTAELGKEILRRIGGMKAPIADMTYDLVTVAFNKDIYDFKGDKVIKNTDPALVKLRELALFELKKIEPISVSVFKQAKRKGLRTPIAILQAITGIRPTLSERDRRRAGVIRNVWELFGDKEETLRAVRTARKPRAAIAAYNKNVRRVMESKKVDDDIRDEFKDELIVDADTFIENKQKDHRSSAHTLKEVKRLREYLVNFKVEPDGVWEGPEQLTSKLSSFTIRRRELNDISDTETATSRDRIDAALYNRLQDRIGKVSKVISETTDEQEKQRLFGVVNTLMKLVDLRE